MYCPSIFAADLYREMEFSSYRVIHHRDEHPQFIDYILVTGVHKSLGLVTIQQNLYGAQLISEYVRDQDHFEDYSGDRPHDDEALEEQGRKTLANAEAKAGEAGVTEAPLTTSECLARRYEALEEQGRKAFAIAEAKAIQAGVVETPLTTSILKGIEHMSDMEVHAEAFEAGRKYAEAFEAGRKYAEESGQMYAEDAESGRKHAEAFEAGRKYAEEAGRKYAEESGQMYAEDAESGRKYAEAFEAGRKYAEESGQMLETEGLVRDSEVEMMLDDLEKVLRG